MKARTSYLRIGILSALALVLAGSPVASTNAAAAISPATLPSGALAPRPAAAQPIGRPVLLAQTPLEDQRRLDADYARRQAQENAARDAAAARARAQAEEDARARADRDARARAEAAEQQKQLDQQRQQQLENQRRTDMLILQQQQGH